MLPASVWNESSTRSSADRRAGYLKKCPNSAARPVGEDQSLHKVAFYNVGWMPSDLRRNNQELAEFVSTICRQKKVDAFGICEVFNIEGTDVQRKEEIMHVILRELNETGEESGYWAGETDLHYIFLWNTRALKMIHYSVISCGIPSQSYRQAQYFKFHSTLKQKELHIVHNHSPSSGKKKLTMQRREDICTTLWNHVLANSNAAQPAALFGGDFNCSILEWNLCLKNVHKSWSTRRSVQFCRSRKDGHHGDNAVAFNVRAYQQDSGFGTRSRTGSQTKADVCSDDHDVIIVPFYWEESQESPPPQKQQLKQQQQQQQQQQHRDFLIQEKIQLDSTMVL